MQSSPWRAVLAFGMVAASVGFLVYTMSAAGYSPGKLDYISYWASGRQLIHGRDPYDAREIVRLQQPEGFTGDRAILMRNPPVALFLALPLGLVSARAGIIFWYTSIMFCLMLALRMIWAMNGRPANRLHLLGYLFAPALTCLIGGQIGVFLLLGIVAFLYLQQTRPMAAGAALLACALKPHLFLSFGLALLAWAVATRAWRLLLGLAAALAASSAVALLFDPQVWSQYARGISAEGIQDQFLPTLSQEFRLLTPPHAFWLQFLPASVAGLWALWFFWKRQANWRWADQGMIVLIVSVACSPYAWFMDEAVLLVAVLTAVYRARTAGRTLIPYVVIALAPLVELVRGIAIISPWYLWTTTACLLWFLYATGRLPGGSKSVPTQNSSTGIAIVRE